MTSRTSKTQMKRKRKMTAMGKKRKRALRRKGSTPKFKVHP
jgi:hypothetical protein